MEPAHTIILLDSCILIDLLHGRKETVAQIRELSLRGFSLVTSAVCVAEIYAGMRKGEEKDTETLLSTFHNLPLTGPIARKAGEITNSRRQIGRTHNLNDMMIAATAIKNGCAVLTQNRKDFDISEIELL